MDTVTPLTTNNFCSSYFLDPKKKIKKTLKNMDLCQYFKRGGR